MEKTKAKLVGMELQLESSGRFDTVYFHGETMLPFLREADELIVAPTSWKDVVPGDIVTYRFDDKFPTRRIIGHQRRHGRFVIKGDSLPLRATFWVPHEDVIGKVLARKRDGDWLWHTDVTWRAVSWWIQWRFRLFRKWRRFRGWIDQLFPADRSL